MFQMVTVPTRKRGSHISTIDKHCCSYMLNDQSVINCNDSRQPCLIVWYVV